MVAPHIPKTRGKFATKLHPVFRLSRRDWVLATQNMAYIPVAALKLRIGTLADQDYSIKRAIDQLFLGI